jgi:hypothetical protein
MRTTAIAFVIIALMACAALGQSTAGQGINRVFYLAHTETAQDLQEIAMAVRAVGQIRQVSVDTEQRPSSDRMLLADWLVNELNQPAPQGPRPAPHQYRVPGNSDDIVGLLYLMPTSTPQDFQEIAAAVRSNLNIRRLFLNTAQRALVLRGTNGQVAEAERLVAELGKPKH